MKQLYYTLRYGEWSWGWEMYDGKPMIGFYRGYYDGDWYCLHLYKLWIGVHY